MDSFVVYWAFGAAVAYIVGYSVMAPQWIRHAVGRSMVSLAGALALALLPSVLHYAVGVNLFRPWFLWYYRASLFAIGLIMLWRLVVVYRVQRGG